MGLLCYANSLTHAGTTSMDIDASQWGKTPIYMGLGAWHTRGDGRYGVTQKYYIMHGAWVVTSCYNLMLAWGVFCDILQLWIE